MKKPARNSLGIPEAAGQPIRASLATRKRFCVAKLGSWMPVSSDLLQRVNFNGFERAIFEGHNQWRLRRWVSVH
jgi:hypothetical protein